MKERHEKQLEGQRKANLNLKNGIQKGIENKRKIKMKEIMDEVQVIKEQKKV